MDFALSEEQVAVQQAFRSFADKEIRPLARDLDETPCFPRELFLGVGRLGFFGMRYPEPEGSGADVLSYLLAVEELAAASAGVAAACTMQSLMGTSFLYAYTQGALRQRLFVPALRGDVVCTICMTEPDAGSDLMNIRTRAEERGGIWYLSGQKTWITAAPVADVFTVFARTGDKELSVFLVERGAAGLRVGQAIEKLGLRTSLTSEVFFDATPATCMLGERGQGPVYLRQILADIRLMTAALSLGIARAAYQEASAYARVREQFGKPINQHQAVQLHIAQMAVKLEAARRLTQWAAWRAQQQLPNETESMMAKLFASETAVEISDRAARVLASYGFSREYPVERYLRDARFLLIGGGTSEILAINIARGLG